MFGLFMFNFMLFPLVATTVTMPGIVNPIGDLLPGFAQSSTGTGAGTSQGPTSDTVSGSQQNIQSCLVGAGTGALTGGLVGSVVPGIGTLVGAVGGAIIGGISGCALASTFFPSQGSSVFQAVAGSVPILGDFMNALAVALGWVGPFLKFLQDSVNYEFALLVNAPEIGIFLFPFQAAVAVFFMVFAAEYVRGTGIGA